MRRIVILLAIALSLPLAFAQSASASQASEIDGRAVVTFYDAAGEAIGSAGAAAGLETAATVEIGTPDGTVRTLSVTAAADIVADTKVMHRGEEVALPTVLAEIAADADASVEVEIDEEAGTTTRTVTTPAGVVVRIVQSAGAATEVTVDRPDAPARERPEAPAEPDAPSEAPDDEADDEAEAEAEAELDVGVGIGAGIGRAAD